jgi:hypothetical protein
MKFGLAILALCFATCLSQAPKDKKSMLTPAPNGAKCVAEKANAVPSKVLNRYTNSGMDELTAVYSDGKVDVYTDQIVLDWYIQYPAPYSGEFSGPLYITFRDEATRQSIIKKIRNSRPASFLPDMSCTVLDPVYGSPIRRNQDCSYGGPSRNLDFLKYISAEITFTTSGPGNVLLPPGATMPPRLFITGSVLYLSSPRCAGLDTYHNAVDKSIPPGGEYINALDQFNSSLIGYGGGNELMSLFEDSSTKIFTTVLPGYYEVGESDTSLISRSVSGAAAKIMEARRQRNKTNQVH